MSKRTRIDDDVQMNVLTKSRRRCCLCFGLDCINQETRGQIAHLDQNSSNADEDNLAYLCLRHHDQYDGTTSQSKGLLESEVRHWRGMLYEAMRHPDAAQASAPGDGPGIQIGDSNQHVIIGSGNTVNVSLPPTSQVREQSVPLTDREKRLLVQGSSTDHGIILLTEATGAYRLNIAGRDVFNGPPGREFARWKEALNRLVAADLVQRQNNGFEYRVTGAGFDCADRLKAEDPVYSLSNEAIRILRETKKSTNPLIQLVPVDGQFVLVAGDETFDFEAGTELATTWKAGVDQLLHRQFIETVDDDMTFRMTASGHQALKAIDAMG